MASDQSKVIEKIFSGALGLRGSERSAYLEESCGRDVGLRQEVESLLAADKESEDLFEGDFPLPLEPEELSGSMIGSYRLQQRIGRGGMGSVYLAARADREFEQEVALKVLEGRFYDPEGKKRFRQERQILARLQHPNIASLMDGGTTDGGRPYFVMEYVEGRSIDDYCKSENLDISERVSLLSRVCSVVHFLHRNLILHQDLKPGNIMVSAEGEPKLLDFGIARLMGSDSLRSSARDFCGEPSPKTPNYASPEQLRDGSVSTASDVYSLGVLIYKVLTGRLPFACNGSSAERLKLIEAGPPKPPSQVASREKGSPGKLDQDLDCILLKALSADSSSRYSSAEQLAEDLQRYLDGFPVLAREQKPLYRFKKFSRRNVGPLSVLAAVVFLLVGFSIGMKMLKDQSDRLRALAEQNRSLAEHKRSEADAVSGFLIDVFESSGPLRAKGEVVTAYKLLETGVLKVRAEFKGQPLVRASVLGAMGRSYRGLGYLEEAKSLLEESLDIRVRAKADPKVVSTSLINLAHLQDQLGDVAGMLRSSRQAVEVLLPTGDDVRLARATNRLGRSLRKSGDPEGAEEQIRKALRIRQEHLGTDPAEIAENINDLALCLQEQGKIEEAELYCRQALEKGTRIHGRVSVQVAKTSNNCGLILLDKEDPAGAESMLRQSLEGMEAVFGTRHPYYSTALRNLGISLRIQGKFDQAETSFDRALEVLEEKDLSNHVDAGNILRSKAALLLDQGKPIAAEKMARRSLKILQRTFPDGSYWRIADIESVLAATLMSQGKSEEAEPLLRRGYELLKEAKGNQSRYTREALERWKRLGQTG